MRENLKLERPRRESRLPSVLHRADTNLSKNTTFERTTMEQGTVDVGGLATLL